MPDMMNRTVARAALTLSFLGLDDVIGVSWDGDDKFVWCTLDGKDHAGLVVARIIAKGGSDESDVVTIRPQRLERLVQWAERYAPADADRTLFVVDVDQNLSRARWFAVPADGLEALADGCEAFSMGSNGWKANFARFGALRRCASMSGVVDVSTELA